MVENNGKWLTGLKEKEIEVLELLLLGKSVSEIAEKLQISRQAVYKIIKKVQFQEALLQVRGELLNEIIFKLRVVLTKAIDVVIAELDKDTTYRWKVAVEILKVLNSIDHLKELDEKELLNRRFNLND